MVVEATALGFSDVPLQCGPIMSVKKRKTRKESKGDEEEDDIDDDGEQRLR